MTEPESPKPSSTRGARARSLLGVLPYAPAVLLAIEVHPWLAVEALLVSAAVALGCERTFVGRRPRHLVGGLAALLLGLPGLYFVAHGRYWGFSLLLVPALLGYGAYRLSPRRVRRWWSNDPLSSAVTYLLATAACLWAAISLGLLPPANDDVLFKLYAAPPAPELQADEMQAAVRVVDAAVQFYGSPEATPRLERLAAALPARLRSEIGQGVYVTLWRGREPAARGHAAGGPLCDALRHATTDALDRSLHPQSFARARDKLRIQIDLAGPEVRIRPRLWHRAVIGIASLIPHGPDLSYSGAWLAQQLAHEVECGVDGLVLRASDEEAHMVPADPVLFGWLTPRVRGRGLKQRAMLVELSRRAGGPDDLFARADAHLTKFRSFSFGRPVPRASGGRVVRLYRGNVPLAPLDSHGILAGMKAAGSWLLGTVQRDGRFDYEYFPNRDSGSTDYNLPRHAGSVYGLFHMYQLALREPALRPDANAYLEAGIKALGWVHKNLGPPAAAAEPGLVALLDERGNASSGAAALTLLSLLERPTPKEVSHPALREQLQHSENPRLLEGLGVFLVAMIDDRGRVFDQYTETLARERVENEPLYYPGEVMLALARLHRHAEDPRWLAGACAIADRQVADHGPFGPIPDHWVMQALWELYDQIGKEDYARAALSMGDRFVSEQFPPQPAPFPDYAGAYRRWDDLPRTTRACSRSEALGGVLQVAYHFGALATPYEEALLGAARHLVENQFRAENSYYLPRPEKARGAIRMGLVDNHCRIDNNQHAVVGLGHALRVARRREGLAEDGKMALPPVPDADELKACRERLKARP